ncbi:MAG: hypothetical protein ACJ0QV_05850 [Gammaproteobacteria bacterium]
MREGYDYEKIYEYYKSFLVHLSNSSSSPKRLALVFEKSFIDNLGYGLYMLNDKDINDNAIIYAMILMKALRFQIQHKTSIHYPARALKTIFFKYARG